MFMKKLSYKIEDKVVTKSVYNVYYIVNTEVKESTHRHCTH